PAAELLDDARVGGDVDAESAEGPRHERAEEPEIAHPRDHVVRIDVGVLERRGVGAHLAIDELADRGHDRERHSTPIIQLKNVWLSTTWFSPCRASSIASSGGCGSGPRQRAAAGGSSSSRSTGCPAVSWSRR